MMTSLYNTPNYGYTPQPSLPTPPAPPAYGSVDTTSTANANAYVDNSQTYAPTANLSQENYLAYANLNYAPTHSSSVYNHYNPQQLNQVDVNSSYYNLQRPQVPHTQPTPKKEGGGNNWLMTLLPIVAMLFLMPGGLGGLFGGGSRSRASASASASASATATARSSSESDGDSRVHECPPKEPCKPETPEEPCKPEEPYKPEKPHKPEKPSKEPIQVSIQAGLYGDPVSIVKNKDGTVLSRKSLTTDSELFKDSTSRLHVDMNTIGKYTYAQEYSYNVNGNTIVAGKNGKVIVNGEVVAIGQSVELKGGGSVRVTKATGVTNNDEQMPRAYNVEIKAPNKAGDGYENVTFYASNRKTDGKIAYNMDLSKTHELDNRDERVTSGYYANDFAKEYARLSK